MVRVSGGGEDSARLYEIARGAMSGGTVYTRFLDRSHEAVHAARAAGVELSLNGGYEGAERMIAAFFNGESDIVWPIKALAIKWDNRYSEVRHRDLLGAVMGLGIRRDIIGDVLIGDGQAIIFVIEDHAPFVSANLSQAARAKLSVSEAGAHQIAEISRDNGEEARFVVSSMRTDSVIAAAFSLSRSAAAGLIESEQVRINHVLSSKPAATVAEGDLISARGYGRVRINGVDNTKKGRLALRAVVYR